MNKIDNTNHDFFTIVDSLFSTVELTLNKIGKSKVLQDYFLYSIFSFVYSNIINNIFINLEDLKETNLTNEKIIEIKSEYEDVLKEVGLALNLKSNKINKEYYNTLKFDLKKKFPTLKIIENIEIQIRLNDLEQHIRIKNEELKNKIKPKKGFDSLLSTLIIEKYITETHFRKIVFF